MYLITQFSETDFLHLKFQTACSIHLVWFTPQATRSTVFWSSHFMVHVYPPFKSLHGKVYTTSMAEIPYPPLNHQLVSFFNGVRCYLIPWRRVRKGRGYMETKNLLYSTSFAIFGSRCLNHPYLTLGVCVSCGRTQRLQSPPPPAAKCPPRGSERHSIEVQEIPGSTAAGEQERPRLGSWPNTSTKGARIYGCRETETIPKRLIPWAETGIKNTYERNLKLFLDIHKNP